MGKNGFATLLLLTSFIISYPIVPAIPGAAPLLPRTIFFSQQVSVLSEVVPSIGSPAPLWNYTFGAHDGWADAWDIIQLHKKADPIFLGGGQLCIAGTFSEEEATMDYRPYFATFSLPPDDTHYSYSLGVGYANSSLSEAHSVIQTDEGILAVAGAVDWDDDKSRAYMEVYYDYSMSPDSFFNGSVSDAAWSIIEHYPKGLVLTGVTESYGAGGKDVWLLHTDPDEFCTGPFGNHTSLLWNQTYGGLGDDEGRCVVKCTTGGFAITGFTNSFGAGSTDGWLIRTDAEGNHLWDRTYGTVKDDKLYSIIECQSGGFAVVGTSRYGSDPDMLSTMWVIRTDEYGNIIWQKFFGAPSKYCRGYDLVELEDGTFALAGSIQQGSFDMWLVRVASNGTALSFQTFGGPADDEARSITTVTSGGVALAGYTQSYGKGYRDVWVVRVPEDYLPIWDQNPSDQTILYNSNFHYKLNASDSSEIKQWEINNTAKFAISSQGLVTNSSTLDVGRYPLIVRVSDIWGNTATAVFYVNVCLPVLNPILIWSTFLLIFIIVLIVSAPFFAYFRLRKRKPE